MNKVRFIAIMAITVLVAVIATACQGAIGQTAATKPAISVISTKAAASIPLATTASTPTASTTSVNYIGNFSLTPASGLPGTTVKAAGSGFEPNSQLQIVWEGFTGSWNVDITNGVFNGRQFQDNLQPLTTVKTDASGQFATTFTVPTGFGFEHDVRVINQSGVTDNQAAFEVTMQASISASSGPVGSPITIELNGVGWRALENSWEVIYDNKFTGWISSVTTGGLARATIPAVGAPGTHVIQIIHGSSTFPYMNMQQSPEPDRPTWTFEFTVTNGTAIQPPSVQAQSLPIEKGTGKPDSTVPAIWTDIVSGNVGTPIILQGSGLPAGKQLDLLWFRETGSRVSGQGYSETSVSLGKVTVATDGTIVFPFQMPDDLGGPHRIEVQDNGTKLAETSLTISPSAFAISPSSGPAGTIMTIHLKGVGWTQTANIYTLVYDNAYVGYACGFNSQGDVTVYLPATGEPGWHYIDLYPGIYQGTDMSTTNDFRIPQLTALADHPGEKLPVFHFAFLVTSG